MAGPDIFDEIRNKRTAGIVHCGSSARTGLAEAAASFGLATDPSLYRQIEREDARRLIVRILSRDLAYGVELLPLPEAELLANAFLDAATGAKATFFTNGTFHEPDETISRRVSRGATWNPVTTATFDTGVLVLNGNGSACVWVEDED